MLAVAARRGIRAACLLAVSDTAPGSGERIGTEALRDATRRLRSRALAAVSG